MTRNIRYFFHHCSRCIASHVRITFVWYQSVVDNCSSLVIDRLNHPVKRFKPSETRPADPVRPSPYNRRASTNDLYSYQLQQQNVASPPNNLNQPFIKQEIKQEPGCAIPVSCIICVCFLLFLFLRFSECNIASIIHWDTCDSNHNLVNNTKVVNDQCL